MRGASRRGARVSARELGEGGARYEASPGERTHVLALGDVVDSLSPVAQLELFADELLLLELHELFPRDALPELEHRHGVRLRLSHGLLFGTEEPPPALSRDKNEERPTRI